MQSSSGDSTSAPRRHKATSKRKLVVATQGKNSGAKRRQAPAVDENSNCDPLVDEHCFICHDLGHDSTCSKCTRVYHQDCLKPSQNFDDELCPECKIQSVDGTELSKQFETLRVKTMLQKYFRCAIQKFLEKDTALLDWENGGEEIKPSFNTICKRINRRKCNTLCEPGCDSCPLYYATTAEFFSDVKYYYHNCHVIYGADYGLTKIARRFRQHIQKELCYLEACPECYFPTDCCDPYIADHFFQLCNPPHDLVWAQLRGFSYWPAKALKVVEGRVQLRYFGTGHTKSVLPIKSCYFLSELHPVKHFQTDKFAGPRDKEYQYARSELMSYLKWYAKSYKDYPLRPPKTLYKPGQIVHRMQKSISYDEEETSTTLVALPSTSTPPSEPTSTSQSIFSQSNTVHQEEHNLMSDGSAGNRLLVQIVEEAAADSMGILDIIEIVPDSSGADASSDGTPDQNGNNEVVIEHAFSLNNSNIFSAGNEANAPDSSTDIPSVRTVPNLDWDYLSPYHHQNTENNPSVFGMNSNMNPPHHLHAASTSSASRHPAHTLTTSAASSSNSGNAWRFAAEGDDEVQILDVTDSADGSLLAPTPPTLSAAIRQARSACDKYVMGMWARANRTSRAHEFQEISKRLQKDLHTVQAKLALSEQENGRINEEAKKKGIEARRNIWLLRNQITLGRMDIEHSKGNFRKVIDGLIKQCEVHTLQVEKLKNTILERKRAFDINLREQQDKIRDLRNLHAKLDATEKQLALLKEKLHNSEIKYNEYEKKLANSKAELIESESKRTETERKLSVLEKNRAELESKCKEFDAKFVEENSLYKAKLTKAEAERMEQKVKFDECKEKLEAEERKIKELTERIEKLKANKNAKTAANDDFSEDDIMGQKRNNYCSVCFRSAPIHCCQDTNYCSDSCRRYDLGNHSNLCTKNKGARIDDQLQVVTGRHWIPPMMDWTLDPTIGESSVMQQQLASSELEPVRQAATSSTDEEFPIITLE